MAQKVIGSCSAGKKAKAEALFAFMATLVLDANISKAFQHWISTSGCQILSNGCCTAVFVSSQVCRPQAALVLPGRLGLLTYLLLAWERTCWIIQFGRPDKLDCSCTEPSVMSAASHFTFTYEAYESEPHNIMQYISCTGRFSCIKHLHEQRSKGQLISLNGLHVVGLISISIYQYIYLYNLFLIHHCMTFMFLLCMN